MKQTEPHPVPLKLLATVLENGSLEEDDSLQDRWAALLINAGPSGQEEKLLLNSAPEMLKQLNKWEIMLLERCMEALKPDDYMPLPVPEVRSQLNTIHEWSLDLRQNHPGFDRSGMRYSIDFGIMIQNLVRLRLLKTKEENGKEVDNFLTTLGYHFVLLCNFPRPWVQGPPPPPMKIWIREWAFEDERDEERNYIFGGTQQSAKTWNLRKDAEAYMRRITNEGGMFISVSGRYTCKNFAVEQSEDGKFVISCDSPIIEENDRAATSDSI